MSEWYGPAVGRYRTSLVYKVFYIWGWPAIRWAMFRMDSERAHHIGILGLRIVGGIDTAWFWISLPIRIAAVVVLLPLAILWETVWYCALRSRVMMERPSLWRRP